jgi:hypothetical protein
MFFFIYIKLKAYIFVFVNIIIHSNIYNSFQTSIHMNDSDRSRQKEMFGVTKGVIRYCKSKKDIQYNGQKKKVKRTNNDLQNITQKTKDRATRTPQKQGMNSGTPEG